MRSRFGVSLITVESAIAGPFNGLAGRWSGNGVLHRSSSQSERLRCLADYDVAQNGAQLSLRIRCATESYKLDLTGYIINSGGAISGQWSEPNYNSAGTLTGRASDGHINANAIGNTFFAFLSVTTRGKQQSIAIRPQATDVTRVLLALRKN